MLDDAFGTRWDYRKNAEGLRDSGCALLTSANDFLCVREQGKVFSYDLWYSAGDNGLRNVL